MKVLYTLSTKLLAKFNSYLKTKQLGIRYGKMERKV